MEFIIGPVVAVLLSGSGLYLSNRKHEKAHEEISRRIEALEVTVKTIDNEVPKRMVTLIAPVAKAVKGVRQEIGVE